MSNEAEYTEIESGDAWTVCNLPGLNADFNVTLKLLPGFHSICDEVGGAPCEIVRRLYGINPLIVPVNTDAKFLSAQSKMRIGADLGMTEDELNSELSRIAIPWERWLRRNAPPVEIAKPKVRPKAIKADIVPAVIQPPPKPRPKVNEDAEEDDRIKKTFLIPPLDDEKGMQSLIKYGFTDDTFMGADNLEMAKVERIWLIDRIEQLQRLLDENIVSAMTRQSLFNEILLKRIEGRMFQTDIGAIKFQDLQDMKKDVEKSYREQWVQINELCPWASEVSDKMKVGQSISTIIEAVKEYQSKKTNKLVDGLHNAYGIQILLREAVQHPIRYRAGQNAAFLEAMDPVAFWDPNWKSKIPIHLTKAMDEGFREAFTRAREATGRKIPDLTLDDPINGEYDRLFTEQEAPKAEPEEPSDTINLAAGGE